MSAERSKLRRLHEVTSRATQHYYATHSVIRRKRLSKLLQYRFTFARRTAEQRRALVASCAS